MHTQSSDQHSANKFGKIINSGRTDRKYTWNGCTVESLKRIFVDFSYVELNCVRFLLLNVSDLVPDLISYTKMQHFVDFAKLSKLRKGKQKKMADIPTGRYKLELEPTCVDQKRVKFNNSWM